MSDITKKPSEKILSNPYDGKEVTDSQGRKLKLRSPDILDLYDLMSAIGDDSKNTFCANIASRCLYIGMIDGQILQSPKSLSEFRINLKRIGEAGLEALNKAMEEADESKTEQEETLKIKK
jgi:hypothetical protein